MPKEKEPEYFSDEQVAAMPKSLEERAAITPAVESKVIPGVSWKPSGRSVLQELIQGIHPNATEPVNAAQVMGAAVIPVGRALPLAFDSAESGIAAKGALAGTEAAAGGSGEAAKAAIGRKILNRLKESSLLEKASAYELAKEGGKKAWEFIKGD